MAIVTMKSLLESGAHFGHQTRRWNPKMAPYIFTSRNGIHILDLQKTTSLLEKAYKKIEEITKDGGKILFIGTKKQVQNIILDEAQRCGMFYVNHRWLGGTLTNFNTIKKRISRMYEIERMEEDGTFEALSKKEVILLKKELNKLRRYLFGIKDMKDMPQAIFIIDPKKERNAILEAKKLKIPLFGIVDTNCDPDDLDYIIPANDDAIRSVKLIVGKMADAVISARDGKSNENSSEKVNNNFSKTELKLDKKTTEEENTVDKKDDISVDNNNNKE